jgi:hypothetical protein
MRDRAIRNIHPNVRTISSKTDAWDSDGNAVVLDESKITKEITRLQAEYDAKQYQRDRQYPSIGEQLDLQYWDKKNGTKKWEEAIDKVKADHPKG